jgi:hypothetical protein
MYWEHKIIKFMQKKSTVWSINVDSYLHLYKIQVEKLSSTYPAEKWSKIIFVTL